MTPDEYLSTRVDEQIAWLSASSQGNQHRFKTAETLGQIFIDQGSPLYKVTLSTRHGESDCEEHRDSAEEYAYHTEYDTFATTEDRLPPQQSHT